MVDEYSSFYELNNGPVGGFSYNIARDGYPKSQEFWCDLCVGWYGIPHKDESYVREIDGWAEGEDFDWENVVQKPYSSLGGHCESKNIDGYGLPECIVRGQFDCACLIHSVTSLFQKGINI